MSTKPRSTPSGLVRVIGAVAFVGLGTVGVTVGLPRMARRNRALLRLPIAKRYNDFTAGHAGSLRSPFALLTHTGRRSGRTYRSPLGACAFRDGFLLPLAYGDRTDWYLNVVAAGNCQLAWKGSSYQLERPELVSGPEVFKAWPLRERITLRLSGISHFVMLHGSGSGDATQQ